MKLELKHLASYLPYGLKGICTDDFQGVEIIIGLKKESIHCNEVITDKDPMDLDYFKPILFPLSSLTEEITINGESFIPIREIKNLELFSHYELEDFVRNNFTYGYIESLSYQLLSQLFEWKFDVFGLIDAGLAEPVTNDFNPYK